jgi:signal transduction histidine kinase
MKPGNEIRELDPHLVHNAKMSLMGELLAGIAHEIKNPLSFVQSNMGNLKKFLDKIIALIETYDQLGIPEDVKKEIEKKKAEINYDYVISRLKEMTERSKGGVDRITKIVTGISSFSRRETDKVEEADINNAIDTTLDITFHEYKNRIDIIKEYGNLPPVECNIGKLTPVFMNLLVNACQAIADKGDIKIKTARENGMVKIEISDTGSGIPDDVADRIFDPFFTTKPEGKGTGIGLSISRDIIKEHQGEISVNSEVGEGTTFTIKVPISMQGKGLQDKHIN